MDAHSGSDAVKYREYLAIQQAMQEALQISMDPATDTDLRQLAEEEYYTLKDELLHAEEELKILLIPGSKNRVASFLPSQALLYLAGFSMISPDRAISSSISCTERSKISIKLFICQILSAVRG